MIVRLVREVGAQAYLRAFAGVVRYGRALGRYMGACGCGARVCARVYTCVTACIMRVCLWLA